MKSYTFLFTAFFLCFANVTPDQVEFQVCFGPGKEKPLVLSRSEIDAVDSWEVDRLVEPPVSVGESLRIAKKQLDTMVSDPKYSALKPVASCDYELIGFKLEPIEENKWIYRVEFEEHPKGNLGWPGGEMLRVDILVDMSGNAWIPKEIILE